MTSRKIILASQSPSRKELLSRINLPFSCAPQDIDETPYPREKPHPYVRRLAQEKALSAQKHYPDAIIIAADTIAYKGHTILQKPANAQEALAMIKTLSGTRHRVFTGLCVAHKERICVKSIVTRVQFRRLQPQTMKAYIDSKQWEGVSGGYAITSPAVSFIKKLNGSFSSLIGLPLAELCVILQSFGVQHDF